MDPRFVRCLDPCCAQQITRKTPNTNNKTRFCESHSLIFDRAPRASVPYVPSPLPPQDETTDAVDNASELALSEKVVNKRRTENIPCISARMLTTLLAAAILFAAGCGTPKVQPETDVAELDTNSGTDAGQGDVAVQTDAVGADVVGDECITDYDCKDAKGKTPCSLPRCNNGYCGWDFKAVGSACDDEANLGKDSACEKARCDDKGVCAKKAEPEGAACVPDGGLSDCERAGCNLAMECTVTIKPDETKCGDGECGEWCQKGTCTNVPDIEYEDGNPCTKDYCEQNSKVMHDPITSVAACDDGNPCTGDGSCKAGKCESLGSSDCDDGLPCTKDVCGKAGCEHTADDKACTDDGGCFNIGCDLAAGCTATTVINGGKCDDGDSCTVDEKCDALGACVASKNKCTCKDDADCDQTDLCLPRFCDVTKYCVVATDKKVVCDKHSSPACGKNLCDPKTGQCSVVAENNGGVCDDGDKCTTKTECKDGDCTGPADLKCDDKNPCTADSCSDGCKFSEIPGDCDDGVACTEKDTCVAGGCTGQKKPCDDGITCTFDSCDPKTGACTNAPKANKPCEDNNPCTTDSCDVKSGCKNVPNDKAPCEDDDACTVTACKSGKCVTTKIDKTVAGCGCTTNKQCNDNNPCTADVCDKGDCQFNAGPQNGKACQGGNLCMLEMKCSSGACTGGKKKVCSDNNPCTNDACSAKTGKCTAAAKADGTTCDADGSLCTQKDACKKGTCTKGPLKDCSGESDSCNLASCNAKTGACQKNPKKVGEACEDGKFCTANDKCDGAGKCKAGGAKTCNSAADACNTGICDEAKQNCVKKPKAATTSCNDGQYCSTNDKCDGKGSCVGGKARVCQSNPNACKAGYCDEKGDKCALKAASSGSACNDGNLCTQTDKCNSKGVCKGSNPKSCTGDQCNTGVCDSKTGACGKKAKANGTKCNDANLCTQTDTCQSGSCEGSNNKKCPSDQCNSGVCASKTGACSKKPKTNGSTCSDGNSCTSNDVCSTGVCKGKYSCACKVATQAADCNDQNSCTKDLCQLVSGKYTCKNNVLTGSGCSDGNKCTTGDVCSSKGACLGKSIFCNDKNACTVDSCNKETGKCVFKTLSGFPCNDGNLCTSIDTCTSKGTCLGKAIICNDGKVCTTDSCSGKTGKCQYINNTVTCSDGNACTLYDKCDGNGKCKAGALKKCTDTTKCTTNGCNTKTGQCTATPAYENSSCEYNYSLCSSGACKCRVWSATFGGASTDIIYGIAKVSDLGTVSVGQTYVSGKSYEGYIVRQDKTGKVLWAKSVAGGTQSDILRGVTATTTKNVYMAVGYRYLNSTYKYVGWVVRFNTSGTILSNTTINLTTSNDYLMDVISDGKGNYYASGYTYGKNANYSSGWLVRLNSSGTPIKHSYKYGLKVSSSKITRYNYQFYAIALYGSYLYLAGTTSETQYGSYDGVVTRFTTAGSYSTQWRFGASGYDVFNDIILNGSSLYVVGRKQNKTTTANGYDAWIIRMSSGGTKYMDKMYGSTGTDEFQSVDAYGSGFFAVGLYYNPQLKKSRGYAVRGSSSGYVYGQYYYGSTSYNTNFYAVEDNGTTLYYTMGGYTSYGNQAYTVQTYYSGVYTCGKYTLPGLGGNFGQ